MRLLHFMLLMPLSALAHLTPSTTSAKKGYTIRPRSQTAKNGNALWSQEHTKTKTKTKTNVKTIVTATTGPYQKDCDHWHSDPQVREWGGIPKVVKDARQIVDLVLSVRNGTTTEVGLLGPEDLLALEWRYFGVLDAERREYLDGNFQRLQQAWDRTTYRCRSSSEGICNMPGPTGWVLLDMPEPVVNVCPWWWSVPPTWRQSVGQMFQYENDWGVLREAGLIHEMLHLKIVGESRSSKCHFVSWWTPNALLTLEQSWTLWTKCTAHQNAATIAKCTDPKCVKEQFAMALIQP
ncbi:hypothetical protein CB0940_11889 [Cercospora beticola]|uniref:Lysine-specific metallo-endopeptidase domain-containing protein n=1 Tax=Cercospora beticola TaxID=122368 RepID=A0A2G5IF20_CERBT|nr:hypothetical protein CB0940_11889 [Cercospora beticola]PIB03114.1 hypothetical protein CB0940_11889 [Cercospora beticola]